MKVTTSKKKKTRREWVKRNLNFMTWGDREITGDEYKRVEVYVKWRVINNQTYTTP
jgi:hypothetical protein